MLSEPKRPREDEHVVDPDPSGLDRSHIASVSAGQISLSVIRTPAK